MIEYTIVESYDGRLPQYDVVEYNINNKDEQITLKSFDSQEEAEEFIKSLTE